MRSPTLLLLASSALAHAAITPQNLEFEDPAAPFPSGWVTSGTVTPASGFLSPVSAQLAAGISIHQDPPAITHRNLNGATMEFRW